MRKKGIDVSKYQGSIDFEAVHNDGIDFVIPRTGYAKTYLDPMFMENVRRIKNVPGLLIPAVYHFSYALSVADAKAEAQAVVGYCQKAGLDDVIIFYDFEGDSIRYANDCGVMIDKAKVCAFTMAFCDEVQRLGYRAGVYFNMHYYKKYYSEKVLSKYIKWLADWTGDPDIKCEYHQTSESGIVKGIKGPVDTNYFYGESSNDTLSVAVAAHNCMIGKYGNGNDRKKTVEYLGVHYPDVQYLVNELCRVRDAVIDGKYGNGDIRIAKLTEAGYDAKNIQQYVNDELKKQS